MGSEDGWGVELHFEQEAVVTEILSMEVILSKDQRPEGPLNVLLHYIFEKQMEEV